MNIKNILVSVFLSLIISPLFGYQLFSQDEPIQDGINVFEVSKTFTDIYQKLDTVKWAGKGISIAIESLEKLNKDAYIAATDDRIVLVWKDSIVANFPRPGLNDWDGYGQITTALVLKFRALVPGFRNLSNSQMYQTIIDALLSGIDENGRYIYSKKAEIAEDGRILTSVGLEGGRDKYSNFRITGVYKDSPADNAGLKSDDLIIRINGKAVQAMDDPDLTEQMSGFNSGTLKIGLLTPTGEKQVVLRRASIILADADIVYRNDVSKGFGILEIVVHKISDNSVAIINEALARYSDVSGIILDLRASFGDDERAAAKMGGLFMGQTPIMRIVEEAKKEVEIIPGGNAVTNTKIIVLMSNTTRGTAEALVAAFYENKRGILVGTPTAGNARIATKIDLDNGGALELLNKSVKTGQGYNLDGRGVFPIVCLSNIRSDKQQGTFFLNILNNSFNYKDFNRDNQITPEAIRKGCPVITSGDDEDKISSAVSVRILTDEKIYGKLMAEH